MSNLIKHIYLVSILLFPALMFGQSFDFQQKVISSERQESGYFGKGVAIDGNFAAVGSWKDNYDENGENYLEFAGAAYVYEVIDGEWTLIQKLVAPNRNEDIRFGYSVDIQDSTILIGA